MLVAALLQKSLNPRFDGAFLNFLVVLDMADGPRS